MPQPMTAENPIRVVLVDDHAQMHRIVHAILGETAGIKLVGQGANGQEGIALCEQYQPDVTLMDVVMPVMDGIEATKVLHERFPAMKILVLSSFQDHESVYAMLRNGAVGYLTKSSLAQDLAETIRATFQGKMVFSSEVGAQLVSPPQPAVDYHLTDRELQVLVLMAEGMNMPEMAAKLVVSPATAKFHVENICRKLGVRTRSEALVVAAKNNLV
ncbi:MAG: response regulator transcription factor [Anaerolineales bacterium]|nr:response regulator transcription factor [Anaerolineales bacterium]